VSTQLNPYTGPILPLTEEDREYFRRKYEIGSGYAAGFINRAGLPRYILPILAPNGAVRGHVLRTGWEGSPIAPPYPVYKKALTYMCAAQPVQSVYLTSYDDDRRVGIPLVLVEDQLSAIKLHSAGYNAVALLGVPNDGSIGADRVREIARLPCSEVIVALDADATENAFQFVRKYGMAFKKIRVAILEKDIKDTPKACFHEVLCT
jgi:hypothetical protein